MKTTTTNNSERFSVESKSFCIKKSSSGFNYTLQASFASSPNASIRSIEIVDWEVRMTDREPSDTMYLTFNSNALDGNTQQLKEFCEFILNEINNDKAKKNNTKN